MIFTVKHRYVLGVDPSGNFYEGKGTTGYWVLDCKTGKTKEFGSISAKNCKSQLEYWENHLAKFVTLNKKYKDLAFSVEDYRLYAAKAKQQINSTFETIQLIGIIKYWMYATNRTLRMRLATLAKNRFSDLWLEQNNYIYKKNGSWYCKGSSKALKTHERDALRHALYYMYFENE